VKIAEVPRQLLLQVFQGTFREGALGYFFSPHPDGYWIWSYSVPFFDAIILSS
jgi:hypothetical protein